MTLVCTILDHPGEKKIWHLFVSLWQTKITQLKKNKNLKKVIQLYFNRNQSILYFGLTYINMIQVSHLHAQRKRKLIIVMWNSGAPPQKKHFTLHPPPKPFKNKWSSCLTAFLQHSKCFFNRPNTLENLYIALF